MTLKYDFAVFKDFFFKPRTAVGLKTFKLSPITLYQQHKNVVLIYEIFLRRFMNLHRSIEFMLASRYDSISLKDLK